MIRTRDRRLGEARVLATIAALASLGLSLATIAPSITIAHSTADSGELVAVAHGLGVGHAPGYGLYLLLARAALEVFVVLEEPALRTNVLSALLTAGGVGVVVLTARRWTSALGALGAGVVVATAPVIWSQAIVTEVYAPAFLLAALGLWAAARLPAPGTPSAAADEREATTPEVPGPEVTEPAATARRLGPWAMLGLVLGTAAAHHPTGWVLAGVFTLFAAAGRPRPMQVGVFLGAAVVPLIVAGLYLVLRADAAVAWGETDTLGGWWHHLSGADYRWLWEWSPAEIVETLPGSIRELLAQFPPPAWLLIPAGLFALWERRPLLTAALLAHAVALVVLVSIYRASGREPYLAGAVAGGALATGLGIDVAREQAGRLAASRPGLRPVIAAVTGTLLAIVIVSAVQTGIDTELRGDRSAEVEARALLAAAGPGAVVHSDRDELTFPLWYLHVVRGVRPDVTIVDVRGLAPVVGPEPAPQNSTPNSTPNSDAGSSTDSAAGSAGHRPESDPTARPGISAPAPIN